MPQKVIQSLACAILHNFIKKCNMGRKSHGRHIAVCFRIMKTATRLTSLQQKVAREIVALVRRENRLAGHHLSKLALAKAIGTSHNPVEAALAHLARVGIARHEKDRGYFLARDASRLGTAAEKLMPADDPLYRRILDLRLDRHLSDTISETGLTRRLGATRSAVHKALVRIQQEGWIERRAGHGWAFLPLIDSVESYEDNFEMRRIIEPACILGRRFAADPAELDTLKRQQAFMASGGYGEMTPVEWADINAHFHETLARWSGNRFMLQTMRRINQLRRLVEYRAVSGNPEARARQATEHLRILEAIERGDRRKAARLLCDHLDGASRQKVQPAYFAQAGKRKKS
jgi:DNA-binding GntR family transcriptional regulator